MAQPTATSATAPSRTGDSASTAAAATTPTAGFEFPPYYHFPPMFTIQPNLTTRKAQMNKWSALVRDYCRHHRIFRLRLSGAPADTELFCNPARNRRLGAAGVRAVMDFMRDEGTAEYCRADDGAARGTAAADDDDEVWIYWRSPAEWAGMIEGWVDATAQKGCVLTLHEMSEGDSTLGTEFHGLDQELLLKALNVLVKRGKAQVFGKEDSRGVKFF